LPTKLYEKSLMKLPINQEEPEGAKITKGKALGKIGKMREVGARSDTDRTGAEPLASQIRPSNLIEFIGQEHLVGEGKPLRTAIEKKHLFSFILWGPPGVGKTTLARIYAKDIGAHFYELSAVSAGKDDIRKIVEEGKGELDFDNRPKILFLDEIHRFNKSQQDFLLPYVESGELVLVGATTENPSFEVIAPLLSRARVFVLNELSQEEMSAIIEGAAKKAKTKMSAWRMAMHDKPYRLSTRRLACMESSPCQI
jgi:putative ATPase